MEIADILGTEWNESLLKSEGLTVRIVDFGKMAQITWRKSGVEMSESVMIPSDVLFLIVKGE